MAKYNLDKYTAADGLGFPLNFRRGNPNPLDNSSVWASLEAAQTYAASDPVAYVGQILTVVDNLGGNATVYAIQDEAGTLKKVGTSPVGDEATITVAEDGTVSLYGVSGLELTRTEPDGTIKKINYQPLLVDGKLTWVEPSATTVEGLATEIAGLKTRVSTIEGTVGNSESGLVKDVADNAAAIATLVGSDTNKSVREIATDELAKQLIPEGAKESLDTLQEIAAWIQAHPDDASAMSADITKLQNIVAGIGGEGEQATVVAYVNSITTPITERVTTAEGKIAALETVGAEKNIINSVDTTQFSISEERKLSLLDIAMSKVTGLTEALAGKVNVEEGKGLSSNDFTTELLNKLNGIEAGAQVNDLEVVKIAGVALPITDKAVDIPKATAEALGVVLGSVAENKISVGADGTMEVNSVNVNKLTQTEGEFLILDGGSSAN